MMRFIPLAALAASMILAVPAAAQRVSVEAVEFPSRDKGGDITLTSFKGATHGYNTPTESRQSVAANAAAKSATESDVLAFLAKNLKDE